MISLMIPGSMPLTIRPTAFASPIQVDATGIRRAVWKAPLWPSKWMIVVAASLLLLQGIVKLIADVMILLGWDPDQEAFGPVTDGDAEKVDV